MAKAAPTPFLIDSFVFPGNSGSSEIVRLEIAAIQGPNTAYLIGVAIDYKTYADMSVSPQTCHVRVSFEENAGLAEVIPIDRVNETIEAHLPH